MEISIISKPIKMTARQLRKIGSKSGLSWLPFRQTKDQPSGPETNESPINQGQESRTGAPKKKKPKDKNELKRKIEFLRNQNREQREKLTKLRRRVARQKSLVTLCREHFRTLNISHFARACWDNAEDLAAEVVVAHDTYPLLGAHAVASASGARFYCDLVEVPSLARSIELGCHPHQIEFLDAICESYLRKCDALLTIGPSLAERLTPFDLPVTVVPNYRYRETAPVPSSPSLRQRCGLAESDRLVLAMSTIATGFETVLESLCHLPDTVHLATMGHFAPPSYKATVDAEVERLHLQNRVHFFPEVPYSELTHTACAADLGLIVRDPAMPNNYISLPNRVFDYLASGLPFCAPRMPDIANIIETRQVGTVVEEITPRGWATAIMNTLPARREMSRRSLEAAQDMTWESLEERFLDALGHPASVTFFGIKGPGLHTNNRTSRMVRTLVAHGTKVKVFSMGDPDQQPEPMEGVEYLCTPRLNRR